MKKKLILLLTTAALLGPAWAVAQSDSLAEQRGRIADQRIQAEAERIAREEEERQRLAAERARAAEMEAARRAAEEARLAEVAAARASARQPGHSSRPVSTGSSNPAPSGQDYSRTLEQIRALGELKDAGYVTEDEFDRIKNRILDGEF